MFLQPSEVGFLKHLKEARVPVVEFEFPTARIVNVQSQLEKLIGQNYYLNKVSSTGTSLLSYAEIFVVCERWIPLIPSGIRITQSEVYLRRAQT